MIKEFVGKTEKEAISKAIDSLGLNRDEFEVEIMETDQGGFFFKRGSVRIKVHFEDSNVKEINQEIYNFTESEEKEICNFLEKTIELMGYPGNVSISFRESNKIGLNLVSDFTGILIGKRGKNLDALQLLVNVFSGKIAKDKKPCRIVVDAENYRSRREENIIKLANKVAEQVCSTKNSRLLEPMNPFERRIIHTALNDNVAVITKSEGDGLYKQVRIIYKGSAVN